MKNKKSIPIIHIIGLPGAGKTTLSRKLSKVLKMPVLRIGYQRAQFPKTFIGETNAWVALFQELSRCQWKNCILETTGLNSRESFLAATLPARQMFTIKLKASRKNLFLRIKNKKKKDRGGRWFYSPCYKDKYEFVKKLFKKFCEIPADCCIDTNGLNEKKVYERAFERIDNFRSLFEERS